MEYLIGNDDMRGGGGGGDHMYYIYIYIYIYKFKMFLDDGGLSSLGVPGLMQPIYKSDLASTFVLKD